MIFAFDVKQFNMGHSAGRMSGSIDLGDEGCPLEIKPENILDIMINMETVSEEDRKWYGISNPVVKYYLFRHEIDEHDEERVVMARIKDFTKI